MDQRPSVVMGFAAETENIVANAQSKLSRKALDCIFVNDVSEQGIGFNSELNAGLLINSEASITFDPMTKRVLAAQLISHLAKML